MRPIATGETFRRANELQVGEYALVDYEQYPPSYEAPASFIGAPVFDGNRRLGVLLFQMPLDTISEVMGARYGLGEGGDAFDDCITPISFAKQPMVVVVWCHIT